MWQHFQLLVVRIRIEGNPFITRFKTALIFIPAGLLLSGIEGNPFITRFKTLHLLASRN